MFFVNRFIKESRENLKSRIINNSEYYEASVYPDIIVHKRGDKNNNLLIIEVKKHSNLKTYNYDCEKLEAYTYNIEGNSLNYSYGVLIKIKTGDNFAVECDKWYRNGKKFETYENNLSE